MVKIFPIIGAFLSVLALILLSIGVSTNQWVVLQRSNNDLNPQEVNEEIGEAETRNGVVTSAGEILYSVSHFGLWIGCHMEQKGAVSCSYIGSSCYSDVCWIRQTTLASTRTCLDRRVRPVTNCTAYQVVRAFVCMGILIMVFGVSTQLVSLVTVNRSLAMLAGLSIFTAGLFIMTAFAVFYSENWVKPGLSGIGHTGYSFTLVVVAWPLSLVSGLISCCAASMGLRHKEVSDYSASSY